MYRIGFDCSGSYHLSAHLLHLQNDGQWSCHTPKFQGSQEDIEIQISEGDKKRHICWHPVLIECQGFLHRNSDLLMNFKPQIFFSDAENNCRGFNSHLSGKMIKG